MVDIVITGPDLKPLTDPFPSWSQIDVTLAFNEVGVGTFTHPAIPRLLNVVKPGNRVAIYRNGATLISGPIEKPGKYRWAAADQSTGGVGVVTVAFADNLARVVDHITYPNPAVASTAQTVDYWTRTAVNAETVLRDLVNLNAGPGALTARRVTGLALGTVAGVGGPVTVTTRFDQLGDVMRYVAQAGGNLGFRVRETGGQLLFEVYAPVDRSKSVVFSRQLGNLRELATDPEAPVATAAIVGGVGSGASRLVVERTNATALAAGWPRSETFVNQSGVSDTTGLQQYGDQALADKAEKVGLSAVAVDTPAIRYGVNYGLGDRVGVVLATGVMVTDIVRTVRVQISPTEGEQITPTIGATDTTTDAATVAVIRDMLSRLGRLERS